MQINLTAELRLNPDQNKVLGHWMDITFSWLLVAMPHGLLRIHLHPGRDAEPSMNFFPLDLSKGKIFGHVLPSGSWTLADGEFVHWCEAGRVSTRREPSPEGAVELQSCEYSWSWFLPQCSSGEDWAIVCPFRGTSRRWSPPDVKGSTKQSFLTPQGNVYLWVVEDNTAVLYTARKDQGFQELKKLNFWFLQEGEQLISCHPYLPLAVSHRAGITRFLSGNGWKYWSDEAWCWTRLGLHLFQRKASFLRCVDAWGRTIVLHQTMGYLILMILEQEEP